MKNIFLTFALLGAFGFQFAHADSHPLGEVPLDGIAAQVNHRVITTIQVDKATERLKNQILANKQAPPPDDVLRSHALKKLIDTEIQLQLAQRLGMTVDENDIKEAIENIKNRNRLTQQQFENAIKTQGLTFAQYKKELKKDILVARLQREAVGRNSLVTEEQITNYIKQHPELNNPNLQYHIIDYLIPISKSDDASQQKQAKTLSDKLSKAFSSKNSLTAFLEKYDEVQPNDLGFRKLNQLPTLFSNKVIHLKKGEITKPFKAPNGYHILKLVDIQGHTKKEIITQTHVRHILVKVDVMKDENQAKGIAQKYYEDILHGGDFASIAKANSDDSGSAQKGGDLSWVSPGKLVPNFQKAMDALPLNTLSKPVRTQYGWHLIEVLGRRKIDNTEAALRAEVSQRIYQQHFAEQLESWLQEMRAQAFVKIKDK